MCSQKILKDVSVIIPTLNRCNFLKRALDSVLTQTIKPKEIIVIDNGSSDNTKEMVCSLFPSVKFVKETRRGVSAARNKGIKLAKSEWLAFLDSDDLWKAKKLEKQLLFACQNKDKFRLSVNKKINVKMSNMNMKIVINKNEKKKDIKDSMKLDKTNMNKYILPSFTKKIFNSISHFS